MLFGIRELGELHGLLPPTPSDDLIQVPKVVKGRLVVYVSGESLTYTSWKVGSALHHLCSRLAVRSRYIMTYSYIYTSIASSI
jgi:hypothetical protein